MSIEDEIRRLSESLQARIDAIADAIHQRLIRDVPEYYESGDPALLDADIRSTRSALSEIFDGLSHGRTPPERVYTVAIEEARLAAQAGVGLQVLLRTHRVAQAVCLQAIIQDAERLIDDPECRVAVLTLAVRYQFEWNDRVNEAMYSIYQHERDRLFRDRERQKRELVRDVLDGLPVDMSKLAYNLRGEHLAIVAWGASPDEAVRQLAGLVEGTALSTAGTAGAVFAWIGFDPLAGDTQQVASRAEPPEATFLALGEPASGLDGFRSTHRQALQAYRVAHVRKQPVTLYRDVALEALVARDLQLARDFVTYELGAIAANDHRDAVLRATLKAYFQTGQNASSAAHLLGVHERTIAYRLRSVEQRLGVPISARRDELAVALRLVDLLYRSDPSDAELPDLPTKEREAAPL